MNDQVRLETKVFPAGPEKDDVSIGYALARFMSEDTDENLKEIDAITYRIYDQNAKYSDFILISSRSAALFAVVIFAWMIKDIINYQSIGNFFDAFLGLSFLAVILAAWGHVTQYGLKWPKEPVRVPHNPSQSIDEFLNILQRQQPHGKSIAYYYPRFIKKKIFLNRRQFFGRFRYLHFSERINIRHAVTNYWNGLPVPANIYIHRSDLDQIIASGKSKRKSGKLGGTNLSPRYAEAIIGLIGDERLFRLGLGDRENAISKIVDWMAEPYNEPQDEAAWKPRPDHLKGYAEQVYARLKNLRSSG